MRQLLLLLAFVSLLPLAFAEDKPTHDVLVTGGRIVDGTGNPWFSGDVVLEGERRDVSPPVQADPGRLVPLALPG